jgi:hypothetical protein
VGRVGINRENIESYINYDDDDLLRLSPPCRGGGGGLAGLNDLTGYAGGNFMFLLGPHKSDRP